MVLPFTVSGPFRTPCLHKELRPFPHMDCGSLLPLSHGGDLSPHRGEPLLSGERAMKALPYTSGKSPKRPAAAAFFSYT